MDTQELWKPIPGFPNYLVSDLGNFKRQTLSGFKTLNGKVDRIGYRQIGLLKNGKQEWFLAHRVVAATFLHPDSIKSPSGSFLTVNHKNRVKTDNRLLNLELVSVAENHRHWRKKSLESMSVHQGTLV